MTTRHHQFDYIEIPTPDVAAAKKFYGAAFGWKFKDWGDDYAEIVGAGLAGGLRRVPSAPAFGGTLAIVYSEDLPASERAVAAAGGTILERHEFPGGQRFHFVDPTGIEGAVWTKEEAEGEASAAKPKAKAPAKGKPSTKVTPTAKPPTKAKPPAKVKPPVKAKPPAKAKAKPPSAATIRARARSTARRGGLF